MGILFLLDNFYILDFGDLVRTFWPLILIAIGIKILMDRRKGPPSINASPVSTSSLVTENNYKAERISKNNVFGDVFLNIKSDKFSGGSVNNVFGDIRIDFSEAKPGTDAIKIFTSGVFGDITVITPAGIPLHVNANAVAGDIIIKGNKKDGLFPNVDFQDDNYEQSKNKITLQCSIVFGSIQVY
jgi:predicted membrane protein